MEAKVGLLMGSSSDLPKLQGCIDTLKALEIPFEAHVMSAHRTPDAVAEYAGGAAARGIKVLIAAAGGAAHLAGAVAARTLLSVIGIPIEGGALHGMDALLATVQMPGGMPVATVGIGSGGAVNAALLAAQILAVDDASVREKLAADRAKRQAKVFDSDEALQGTL